MRLHRFLVRGCAVVAAGSALLVGAAQPALAYWTASGSGSASASIGTLAAPSIANATAGAGTVALSWSTVAAPASGTVTYFVSRDGGAPSAACPSSSSPSSATSCTETGVSVGRHQYTVTAVWRSWTATSATATAQVSFGPVSQLVLTRQPAGAAGGTAFTTQPVVTAEDAAGNTVTTYAGTVALSIKSGTGAAGAALSSCSGVRSGGVTTFSGCTIDKAGTAYQLRASDGTLVTDSTAFDVTAGAVSQFVFATQPAGAVGGTAFTTQPVVTAQDAAGNTVTTYAGTVALSIKSGTGAAGAALTGCSGARSSGVTTFSGCKIDKAGTGYQLRASDGTSTIDSAAFNVTTGAASRLVLSAATTTPTAGTADNLTITAVDAGGNTATAYTGTHNLRFSGAGTSPDGTQPTVTSSSGNAVVFGTTESISFSSGVATVSGANNGAMTLHKAETASITVTDTTIGNGSGLSVTVASGAASQLAWTHVTVSSGAVSSPCLFTCTATGVGSFGMFTANVSVTDADGNTVSGLGAGHTVTVSTPTRGGGSGGSFNAPTSGPSVTLTISAAGVADSTALFTFRAQNGSSFTDTFSAQTATGTAYTSAAASVTK